MPTTIPRQAALTATALVLIATTTFAAGPRVPEGFEARLIAEVPAIEFPSQVATAPDGSLFVAEDPMDQRGPYEAFNAKILRFRDGNEPHIYAENFRAIQGMAWRDGALYVCHMPFLTIIRDADGDGRAESRQDLFKDLGPTDNKGLNDHIVSGLQFGMDGWLYISVGDKGVPGATRPEDGEKVQIKGGGTLRCRPDGTELEVFSKGTRNHLEANLDAADNLFTYDNTDDGDGWWTRVTHHVYGGYYGYPYDYHEHPERFLPRMAEYGGGSPCGAVFYREDAWPEPYRGIGLWAEWGKGKVHAFRFEPTGATFKVAEAIDFATPSGTKDFRPIDLAVSYDGKTLYIADWNMGGWGKKEERVGRVWAITCTANLPQQPRGSDNDPIPAQIKALDHPAYNERMRAQSAIIKQGKTALPQVTAALADPTTPAPAKRHLVWALDAIAGGTPEATLPLIEQLKSPVTDVRAQAARALGERRAPIAVEPLIQVIKNDAEPAARLQAIIALARIGDPVAVTALIAVLADKDVYLAFSARQAIRRIGDWKAVAQALDQADEHVRSGILLACEQVYSPDAVDLLKQFAADTRRSMAQRVQAFGELAEVHRRAKPWDGKWWGTRPTQGKPPAKVDAWSATDAIMTLIRQTLTDPAPELRGAAVRAVRTTASADLLPTLRARFNAEPDPTVRSEIARTFGLLEDHDALPLLTASMKAATEPEEVREASLSAIENIGGAEAANALRDLLAQDDLPAERQARVIAALGRFRRAESASVLLPKLASANGDIRAATAEALARIGRREGVAELIRPLLDDPDIKARRAAITALGTLHDRAAIPALVTAAVKDDTRFEATKAIAMMPDLRGLQPLLSGLTATNADLRSASAKAIESMRAEAAPVLDQLAARKELSPRTVAELRKVYGNNEPLKHWHVLGPFKRDAKTPPFDPEQSIDLKAKFPNINGENATWRALKPGEERGPIDLANLYGGDQRDAFGYAEYSSLTARQAEMVVGSDDTLTVWLNGKQVYDYHEDRGFAPDQGRFTVDLSAGVNRVLVRCGNSGGGWMFAVAIAAPRDHAFLKAPSTGAFDPDSYREFALKSPGNAERGRTLFMDLKGLACVKCHAIQAQGGAVGPDLSGLALLYPKEEIIASVLYPSARIFSGYEPQVIATEDGRVLTGVLKSETPEAVEIQDAEANRVTIPTAQIAERKASDVSIMPSGLAEGLKREDFADLIAYLDTLRAAPAKPPAQP